MVSIDPVSRSVYMDIEWYLYSEMWRNNKNRSEIESVLEMYIKKLFIFSLPLHMLYASFNLRVCLSPRGFCLCLIMVTIFLFVAYCLEACWVKIYGRKLVNVDNSATKQGLIQPI
ncbi:hypothetical protein ACJX0J_008804 [Zea mays]